MSTVAQRSERMDDSIREEVLFKEESCPKFNEVCFESRSKGIIIISGSLLTFEQLPQIPPAISTLRLSLGRSETLKVATNTLRLDQAAASCTRSRNRVFLSF